MEKELKSPCLIIAILCLISAMGRFVIDSYLPSLPAIANQFSMASNSSELTLTLYLLGFGVSQLLYGPLSDCYGRRKVLLTGLVVFLLGSAACMLAPTSEILLVARLVSGLGAGACGVLNRAIARDCFSGAAFAKVWSYTTTTLVITLMLAPLIGGYVQELLSWRANFLLITIFVSSVLAVIYFVLPETNIQQTQQNRTNIFSIRKILSDYKNILKTKNFILPTLLYTLAFAGLMAYFQVSSIILMEHYHFSSSAYGYASLSIALSYLLGGQLVRKFVDYVGVKRMLSLGILILTLGSFSMLITSYLLPASWQAVIISAMVYVLGTRVVIPNAVSLAMNSMASSNNQVSNHPSSLGSVSALIGSIQMLGAMAVSAILSQFPVTSTAPLAWLLVLIGLISSGLFYSQNILPIFTRLLLSYPQKTQVIHRIT